MNRFLIRLTLLAWICFVLFQAVDALTIESPEAYQGISYITPRFLLSVREFSTTGQLVLIENGCAPITTDVEGLIVLVPYNSSCLLFERILNIQNAKALAGVFQASPTTSILGDIYGVPSAAQAYEFNIPTLSILSKDFEDLAQIVNSTNNVVAAIDSEGYNAWTEMYHSAPNSVLIAAAGLLSLFNMGFALYKFVFFVRAQSCPLKSVPHWCLVMYFTSSALSYIYDINTSMIVILMFMIIEVNHYVLSNTISLEALRYTSVMGIIVMGAVTIFVVLYWYGLVFSNKKPSAWLKITLKIMPLILLALLAVNIGGAFSSIAHYVVLAVFCLVLLAILIFYCVVSVRLFKQLYNKNLNVSKSEKSSKSTQMLQKRVVACAIMLVILLCNAVCYVAIGLVTFENLAMIYGYQMTRLGNYVYASAAITIQISFFNVRLKPKSSSGSGGQKSTELSSPRGVGSSDNNEVPEV